MLAARIVRCVPSSFGCPSGHGASTWRTVVVMKHKPHNETSFQALATSLLCFVLRDGWSTTFLAHSLGYFWQYFGIKTLH